METNSADTQDGTTKRLTSQEILNILKESKTLGVAEIRISPDGAVEAVFGVPNVAPVALATSVPQESTKDDEKLTVSDPEADRELADAITLMDNPMQFEADQISRCLNESEQEHDTHAEDDPQ